MKPVVLLAAFCLAVCAASAETKRSSRNFVPLSKRSGTAAAGARGDNAGMTVAAPAQDQPAETVTQVTYLGPKSGWGYVKATSPCYSPEGKRLGTLPGGTLFKYSDVKNTSKNAVLVSTVKRGEAWEGPFLLDCTDIAGFEGAPDGIDPEVVKNLASYFTLNGQVEERKEALKLEALSANPHFEAARQAQQEYQASIEKAAEMEKQMNALTGPRKSKALEALRAFKYEQVRIKAKADQAALAYKTWKDAHPLDPAKLTADPQLQALEKALQIARAKVSDLLPPAP